MTTQVAANRSGSMLGWQVTALAFALGLLVLVVGTRIESAIIAAVGTTGHELEWIGDVIASVAVTTLAYLWLHLRASRARLLDLERSRVALDEQFRLAAEIQRNLLPEIPPTTPGYRWAARMETAYEVGGDFYDFVGQDDGSVLLILGDVSGKGIPAALLQSSLATAFRVHASTTADLRGIAGRMSEALRAQTGGRPYATAVLARLDRSPRRITYVNAGHPPGLLFRGAQAFELDVGGPPLGLLPDVTYERASLDLEAGDFGVFVTDGITEALDWTPLQMIEALRSENLWTSASPADGCEYLLRIAGRAPRALGASPAIDDDRTAFAFRVCDER
jgi:hypothetical protein